MNNSKLNAQSFREQLWYSYSGYKYPGALPAYYDISGISQLQEIGENLLAVHQETTQFILAHGQALPAYFNTSIVEGKGTWNVLHLLSWGKTNTGACDALPVTYSTFSKMPGVLSLGIAALSGNTEVRPHIGDTNAIIRCHLGLIIPSALPSCGIEVNEQQRSWEAGRWLAFCDAHEHKAWNYTEHKRYVLIVDILRDEFISQKADICRNVLSYHKLQATLLKYPWMHRLPGVFLGMLRRRYKKSF